MIRKRSSSASVKEDDLKEEEFLAIVTDLDAASLDAAAAANGENASTTAPLSPTIIPTEITTEDEAGCDNGTLDNDSSKPLPISRLDEWLLSTVCLLSGILAVFVFYQISFCFAALDYVYPGKIFINELGGTEYAVATAVALLMLPFNGIRVEVFYISSLLYVFSGFAFPLIVTLLPGLENYNLARGLLICISCLTGVADALMSIVGYGLASILPRSRVPLRAAGCALAGSIPWSIFQIISLFFEKNREKQTVLIWVFMPCGICFSIPMLFCVVILQRRIWWKDLLQAAKEQHEARFPPEVWYRKFATGFKRAPQVPKEEGDWDREAQNNRGVAKETFNDDSTTNKDDSTDKEALSYGHNDRNSKEPLNGGHDDRSTKEIVDDDGDGNVDGIVKMTEHQHTTTIAVISPKENNPRFSIINVVKASGLHLTNAIFAYLVFGMLFPIIAPYAFGQNYKWKTGLNGIGQIFHTMMRFMTAYCTFVHIRPKWVLPVIGVRSAVFFPLLMVIARFPHLPGIRNLFFLSCVMATFAGFHGWAVVLSCKYIVDSVKGQNEKALAAKLITIITFASLGVALFAGKLLVL